MDEIFKISKLKRNMMIVKIFFIIVSVEDFGIDIYNT